MFFTIFFASLSRFTQAEDCSTGYFLHNNGCYDCSIVHPACVECSDIDTCTRCAYGSFPWEDECSSCGSNIDNCLDCLNESTCVLCKNGYELSGQACVECVEQVNGCSVCSTSYDVGELVVDGSFEDHQFSGAYTGFANDVMYPWYSATSSEINLLRRNDIDPDVYYQYMEPVIDGSQRVAQDFDSLVEGQLYLFSYYYTGRQTVSYEDSAVESQWNGAGLAVHQMEIASDEPNNWVYYSHIVEAQSGTNTLSFEGLSTNQHFGGGIDEVSLVPYGCPACHRGYYTAADGCSQCTDFGEGCTLCDHTGCTQCVSGYFPDDSGNCVSCSELHSGCLQCAATTGECIECETSTCAVSTVNEWACVEYTNDVCTSCLAGYTASGTGACEADLLVTS